VFKCTVDGKVFSCSDSFGYGFSGELREHHLFSSEHLFLLNVPHSCILRVDLVMVRSGEHAFVICEEDIESLWVA
jgi:hypothetical protein